MAPMREASQPPNTRRDRGHPRRRGRTVRWLLALLTLVLVVAGGAAWQFGLRPSDLSWPPSMPDLGADPAPAPTVVPPPAGLDLPAWQPPAPALEAATATGLDPVRIERALRRPLRDDDLGSRVSVGVGGLDDPAGDWTSGPKAFMPASTVKVATVAAALHLLGPEATFSTQVFEPARPKAKGPREVFLVGGGDPYLASKALTPSEAAVTYPVRADLATLATETALALGGQGRVRVRYDDGYFSGPADNPQWRPDYVADDIVSPITALMADGGREPDGWHRFDDPSLAAAQAFAEALREAGLRVAGPPRRGTMPDGSTQIAQVESAPLAQIGERILEVSDNEGAEVLARHVGIATSGKGSFRAGATGIVETLAGLGVDTSQIRLHDGSGLSRHNRLTPGFLLGVLRVAATVPSLRAGVTGLPVAGFTGSLTWRFEDEPARARGLVRAKTGTLTGVHSLAGIVVGRDGAPMVFVVAADRVAPADSLDAREAVDHVAAALARCRCAASAP
jgi:D-alanyl-D-alanine carboxypeptidase/D-alanyl-D-alanine-endopeptidase (penicillin-binding protein 4)